jgi:hypothetical protein
MEKLAVHRSLTWPSVTRVLYWLVNRGGVVPTVIRSWDDEEEDAPDETLSPLYGASAAFAGIVGASAASSRLVPDIIGDSHQGGYLRSPLRNARIRDTADRLAVRDALPGRVNSLAETDTEAGPYFDFLNGRFNLPTSYGEVAAHELGHGLNYRDLGGMLGRGRSSTVGLASRLLLNAAPWSGAASYALGGKARKWAWLLPLALAAPALADELLASVRGYRRYGGDLGASPFGESAGRLARAFGTYGLSAAAPALALYAASRLQGVEEPEREKEVEEVRDAEKRRRRKAGPRSRRRFGREHGMEPKVAALRRLLEVTRHRKVASRRGLPAEQARALARTMCKRAGIGQYLADSPVLTSMLTNGAFGGLAGAGAGAAVGSAQKLDRGKAALIGGLLGLGVGGFSGVFPGLQARRMIKDKAYRRRFHKSPFGNILANKLMLAVPTVIGGGVESLPVVLGQSLGPAAIGSLGHTGNSRTWDTFWSGGGPSGAVASYLDHVYNGPSEDLDEESGERGERGERGKARRGTAGSRK